jgi:hypothetical protein
VHFVWENTIDRISIEEGVCQAKFILEAGDKTKRNASVEAREISFVPRLLIIGVRRQ